MSLDMDDARPGLSNARRGSATESDPGTLTAKPRGSQADDRSTSTPPVGRTPAGLQTRLQAIAKDIDGLWRDALESKNFDLVTRAVEATDGVHRALLALGDDRSVVGRPHQ